jgi:hypothetical protein
MLGRHRSPVPSRGPEEKPGKYSDYIGSRFDETAHLTSVPKLARYLIAELPNRYESLRFSAIAYRYRLATPWLLDVEVHGMTDTDIRTTTPGLYIAEELADLLQDYNWDMDGDVRFAGGHVTLLSEHEQAERAPGRVVVRHYYLTRPLRALTAWARRIVREAGR